jgi:hypothetical protein
MEFKAISLDLVTLIILINCFFSIASNLSFLLCICQHSQEEFSARCHNF